jgi:hypothetical protein
MQWIDLVPRRALRASLRRAALLVSPSLVSLGSSLGLLLFPLLIDGTQLTREIILLRSPATAPENILMRTVLIYRSTTSWEPQKEGMVSTAAVFPQ